MARPKKTEQEKFEAVIAKAADTALITAVRQMVKPAMEKETEKLVDKAVKTWLEANKENFAAQLGIAIEKKLDELRVEFIADMMKKLCIIVDRDW